MSKIRFTSMEIGFEFDHEGMKLRAVEEVKENNCRGCRLGNSFKCGCLYPCVESEDYPKQKQSIIFIQIPNQNEEHN